MKKFDFKKLALMGITGGVMIASQSAVHAEGQDPEANAHLIAAMNCGSKNGCGGGGQYSGSAYSNAGYGYPSGGSYGTEGQNTGYQYGPSSQQGRGYGYQGGYQQNAPYGNPSSNQSYQMNQQRPLQQPGSSQQGQQQFSQTSWGSQNYNEPTSMRDPHPSYYYPETAYEDVQSTPGYTPGKNGSRSNVGGTNSGMNENRGQGQGEFNQKGGQGQNSKWYMADTGKTGQKLTESELLSQLNEQGKAQYNALDAEGKALALQLANGECNGKNSCKGLSSCANSKNSCAGKNACAGQGSGKFTDKNKAVKVAAIKMAEKRSKMNMR